MTFTDSEVSLPVAYTLLRWAFVNADAVLDVAAYGLDFSSRHISFILAA